MTRWYQRVKFPCGYEWKFEFNTWTAELLDIPEPPKQCPIHGDKCSKEKKC